MRHASRNDRVLSFQLFFKLAEQLENSEADGILRRFFAGENSYLPRRKARRHKLILLTLGRRGTECGKQDAPPVVSLARAEDNAIREIAPCGQKPP